MFGAVKHSEVTGGNLHKQYAVEYADEATLKATDPGSAYDGRLGYATSEQSLWIWDEDNSEWISLSAPAGIVNADTINEYTAANGVVIDSVTCKDGAVSFSGNLTINTNKFTVAGATGNTVIAGTLTLGATSDIAVNTNKFTVAAASGNTVIAGTLTLGATSDIAVNTNKFTVAAASGNTVIAGTLGITGVATLTAQPILSSLTASKAVFTDGSKGLVSNNLTGSGNVVMSASPTLTGTITAAAANFSGAVGVDGNFDVANTKFTVAAASGNTVIAGTLNVTGAITATAGIDKVIAADESTDTTCFPLYVTSATGAVAPKTGTNLTFNSSTGQLGITLLSVTGGQIAFPAVQNASSDANTLDDYEEGVYTPTISFSGGGNYTLNTSFDTLAYIKIGKLVHIQGNLNISGTSGSPSGNIRISLPSGITTANLTDAAGQGAGSVFIYNNGTALTNPAVLINEGVTYFELIGIIGTDTAVQLGATTIDSSSNMSFSFSFIASA